MKTSTIKQFVLQALANEQWRVVAEYPIEQKREAMGLLKYKKRVEKGVKWRVIQRTIKEKKVA